MKEFLQFWPKPTPKRQGGGIPIGDSRKEEEQGDVKDVEEIAKNTTVPGHNTQNANPLQQVKKRIPPISSISLSLSLSLSLFRMK